MLERGSKPNRSEAREPVQQYLTQHSRLQREQRASHERTNQLGVLQEEQEALALQRDLHPVGAVERAARADQTQQRAGAASVLREDSQHSDAANHLHL